MRYYVIVADGNRYGPADEAQLRAWVNQGRIFENTLLQEENGTAKFPAGTVLGFFDASTPPPQSVAPTYYRANNEPPLETTPTIIKAVLVMCFCCQPLGIVALVFSILAATAASSNRTQAANNLKTADTIANWAIGIGLTIGFLYALFVGLAVIGGGR